MQITIKKILHLFSHGVRLREKSINFDAKNISESNFYKNQLLKIDDIDFNKIIIFKRESYGTKRSFKYFIGYDENDVIRLLCLKLPKTIGCAKYFYSNKTLSFKVSDKKLLKKYTKT